MVLRELRDAVDTICGFMGTFAADVRELTRSMQQLRV